MENNNSNESISEDEGVYLLHIREFISTNKPIYKLGRSNILDNRVKQYPNGSKIMLMLKCKNSKSCENNLIKLFKSKFIQKTYYGTEYFEGNCYDMIKEISNYINNINCNVVSKKKVLKVVEKKVLKSVEKEVEKVKVEKVDVKKVKVEKVKGEKVEKVKVEKVKVEKVKVDRTCPKCKDIFRYPSDLKIHLETSSRCSMTKEEVNCFLSTIKIKKVIKPSINPIIEENKTNNSKICKICNIIYSRKDSLDRHFKNSKCSKNKE